ncbi:MAG: hypothetical protein ACM3UU_12105 [Ignavibacteriales bacterium]
MENSVLEFNAAMHYNRDIFLLNYSKELNLFEETNNMLWQLGEHISRQIDISGYTHTSIGVFILVILRQANNAFNLISTYQTYDAWVVFRPVIECVLLIGKFLDSPTNADLWMRRKEIRLNRKKDKRTFDKYMLELEGNGLISESISMSGSYRQILTKINDEFMHFNFEYYFPKTYEVEEISPLNLYISVSHTGDDFFRHKAHLLSFLHLYRMIVVSLDEAFAKLYDVQSIVNVEMESVENTWKSEVEKLLRDKPELKDIIVSIGLWNMKN